jgi:hypothetical protein
VSSSGVGHGERVAAGGRRARRLGGLRRAGAGALARTRVDTPRAAAIRAALHIGLVSRACVALAAIYASLTMTIDQGARQDLLPDGTPSPLLHPFGHGPLGNIGELVFAPLARWDAGWYLGIAHGGYADGPGDVFFPAYPLLVHLVSGLGDDLELLMVSAYAVSISAFLGALYVLHRLVELELGRAYARPALLLLAVFPGGLYFGAPYSESVFLLLTISAFYAARTGRWAWAGVIAGAASGARSVGILIVVPIAVLYLYGPREDRAPDREGGAWWRPRHRLRPDALWLALAPAGLAAFCIYLSSKVGDPFAWATYQKTFWGRSTGFPLEQLWTGTKAAAQGFSAFVGGFTNDPVPGHPYDRESLHARNIVLFGFMVFAVVATIGTLRRLPLAYGAWAVAALGVPLSYSVDIEPLLAFQRYSSVVFPLFIWLALVAEERRLTSRIVGVCAVLLGVFTAQFATWHWFV